MGQDISDILDVGAVVAAPFTGGATAFIPGLLGGLGTTAGVINNQIGQGNYEKAMQQGQQGALGQVDSLAGDLAKGPYLQSLIDAEGSGVKTLESNIGGVANPQALIKELFGGNIQNAIGAALNTRSGNLQGAINGLLGAGGQYGSNAAGVNRSSLNTAGGLTSGLGAIFNALSKTGINPGMPSTPTVLGQPPSYPGTGGSWYGTTNSDGSQTGTTSAPVDTTSSWDPSVGPPPTSTYG